LFFEFHRGAASVPPVAIQAIVSLRIKGVSHAVVESYIFLKETSTGVISPSGVSVFNHCELGKIRTRD